MQMGFKMQIYPNESQEKQLFEWCKISHNAWNFLVEKYQQSYPKIVKYGIYNYNYIKLMEDMGVTNVPKRAIHGIIINFTEAVTCYYKNIRGMPKFHKYNPNKQSFYLAATWWKIHDAFVYFPKVGSGYNSKSNVIYLDKEYLNKYNITEIREPRFNYKNGKWYLSGCYIVPDVAKSQSKPMLGLDWGIKNFMTTSEGEFINYPPSVLREYQRIKKLQSIMDKKQYHSNNWYKIYHKFQKAYERLENLKYNFIHQKTTELARKYNISVEDLKGFIASKRFMRRNIMIAPRYRFLEILRWKCDKYGSYYFEVSPTNTSKTCCVCGVVHDMKLRDRTMICECGNELDRDINAAINIANEGSRLLSLMDACCIQ